jgi:hypothetical protein
VSKEGGFKENKIYILIAIFIVIIIFFAVIFSGRDLTPAYIPSDYLEGNWFENLSERSSDSQLFGLEKTSSFTYELEGNWPAYITVTTFKTLFMMNEEQLRDKTIETIQNVENKGIILDEKSKIIGERVLKNGHSTMYIIFEGNDTSKNPVEDIKIIGEVWNCGVSGTSVICIGYSQVSDNVNQHSQNNTSWSKIIKDESGTFENELFIGDDGLLYNVVCH